MDSYNAYRFRMFYDAISEAYPDLIILSSTVELNPIPGDAALDYHDYGVGVPQTFGSFSLGGLTPV